MARKLSLLLLLHKVNHRDMLHRVYLWPRGSSKTLAGVYLSRQFHQIWLLLPPRLQSLSDPGFLDRRHCLKRERTPPLHNLHKRARSCPCNLWQPSYHPCLLLLQPLPLQPLFFHPVAVRRLRDHRVRP